MYIERTSVLSMHFLSPRERICEPKAGKIIERFAFFLPERSVHQHLLTDLFTDFLGSHSQVYNLNRFLGVCILMIYI